MIMRDKTFPFGEPSSSKQDEAVENIRSINRQLLVAAAADISEESACELDSARARVLAALHHFPKLRRDCRVEEIPVHCFKARIEQSKAKFALLFAPIVRTRELEPAPRYGSKLNGRCKSARVGCF